MYVAKLGKLVKVLPGSPTRSAPEGDQDSDTSEDGDCPLRPEEGFKFVWKRDKNGRKYFLSEPEPKASAAATPTYVYDRVTGRTYREEVSDQIKTLPRQQRKDKKSVSSMAPSVYVDHRKTSEQGTQPCRDDRMPTFLGAEAEKQGKETKVPELVQWARDCPVAWTNKITSDKLNVVLFAWSYVSSLLAARTGRAPDLEIGELEAKLQHLLHVLEVTLQTSNQADYSGDSWNVARLYHNKVQQKVDTRQFSWVQLSSMHHNATLPHELMAATQELATKPKTKVDRPRTGGGGDAGKPLKGDKNICASWNRSEVRGKCTYEINHPGEKCKYLHECSWCKSKGVKLATHQRFFCTKRQEADEE